jgi:hypothetical protein
MTNTTGPASTRADRSALGVAEVAELRSVSKSPVLRNVRQPVLPHRRRIRSSVIPRARLEAWLAEDEPVEP